jgi:hypothetical protein
MKLVQKPLEKRLSKPLVFEKNDYQKYLFSAPLFIFSLFAMNFSHAFELGQSDPRFDLGFSYIAQQSRYVLTQPLFLLMVLTRYGHTAPNENTDPKDQ